MQVTPLEQVKCPAFGAKNNNFEVCRLKRAVNVPMETKPSLSTFKPPDKELGLFFIFCWFSLKQDLQTGHWLSTAEAGVKSQCLTQKKKGRSSFRAISEDQGTVITVQSYS